MIEGVGLRANVTIEVTESGRVVQTIRKHNLVVLDGRDLICSRLVGSTAGALDYLAAGTGSTAVASGDSALGTEVYRDQITKTTLYAGQGKLQAKHYIGTTYANGNTITEAGLFNASSGGTMAARVVHDAITKTSSVAITYTWEIVATAS